MANWVELSNSRFTFKTASGDAGKSVLEFYIEYDTDSTSPVQTNIRFRGYPAKGHGGSRSWVDSFFVLYNPDNNPSDIGQIVRIVKRAGKVENSHWVGGGEWNVAECEPITITKEYTDPYFTLQDFWICNNGSYAGADGVTWYPNTALNNPAGFTSYVKNDRYSYTHKVYTESQTFEIPGTQATSVGDGTASIIDNFNNSYTIKGTRGADGTNNPVVSATLKYTNSSGNTTSVNFSDNDIAKIVFFTPNPTYTSDATRSVTAEVTTVGTYNTTIVSTTENIKQYVGPNAPTNLKISYNKSRLTLKENWTLEWAEPTTNNGCPIKGYRIRLYRKLQGGNIWTPLPIYKSNGSTEHVTSNTATTPTDYYWDRDGTETSVTIYTEYYLNKKMISPGDAVKFTVIAYTKYGKDYDGTATNNSKSPLCFYSEGTASSEEYEEYVVQNAGIVRVKVNDEWKEGQVYVKAGNTWHEAETVNIKTSSGWKESQ